jgi:peroxiredoxin
LAFIVIMGRADDLYEIPIGIPEPTDDGACDHLCGMIVPPVWLGSTRGRMVSLFDASNHRRVVVYIYPRTGLPNTDPPVGWNSIPGARGCTPQSCSFRDRFAAFIALGVELFGLSVQTTKYQREAADRLRLPFELLSDECLELTQAMRLPTFTIAGMIFLKRTTLILSQGRVEKIFYPVFPPQNNAAHVASWLASTLHKEAEKAYPSLGV